MLLTPQKAGKLIVSGKPENHRRLKHLWAAIVLFVTLVPGVAALSGMAVASGGQQAEQGQFSSAEKILAWISGYRLEPQPELLPVVVRAMSKHKLFRDHEKSGVYIGFIAGVLGANQLKARSLVNDFFPIPPAEQTVIVKAIAYSSLPDWKGLLTHFVERMPARRVLIERFLFDKEAVLQDLSFEKGPAVLDAHWGYYFATGLYEPVLRIIEALQWSTNQSDLQKLTIGSMAKWTLATNATRDKALLDLCRQELEHIAKSRRRPLYEVVAAAQSFKTDKIRDDALKAISNLKRNPNGKAKKWYSAANIGSTALALGCVVAGVTGHVELGIPCVISGALSSAVLKLWGKELAAPQ